MECTQILCKSEATYMLKVTLIHLGGEDADYQYPYCDEHIDFFHDNFAASPAFKNVRVDGL